MRFYPKIRILILLVVPTVMVGIAALMAAEYGKIKGVVRDAVTNDPIIGATVSVVGTNWGAITDVDGSYVIRRVPPGTYEVEVTYLGKEVLRLKNIRVFPDLTTECDANLKESTTVLEGVAISAEPCVIDKFETSSTTHLRNDAIQRKSATTVDEMLGTVSGVTRSKDGNIYIRGGRAGEVAYYLDGCNTRDPRPGCNTTYPISPNDPRSATNYLDYGLNPFVDARQDNRSTFAFDVDDASFNMARSYIENGSLPPAAAVRTEEFVNHFKYNYATPLNDEFAISIEGAQYRNNQNSILLRIGCKAREIVDRERKPADLTFVIDVSGSMNMDNRLGLVKRALRLLLNQLSPSDRVAIAVYGTNAGVLLNPTSLADRETIKQAIDMLQPNGSTNAEAGLRVGYQLAQQMLRQNRNNRVILCSDGVANVGNTNPEVLLRQIKEYADMGITLTTVGFGMDNYNDVLMEQLGNKGNGHYAYVDDIKAAHRVFVENLNGTLEVIARDVKAQIEFDPRFVRSYRLLGYENREVADKDFWNDRVDGGEIGSGHQVTALYEVTLQRPLNWMEREELASVRIGRVMLNFKRDVRQRSTGVAAEITCDKIAFGCNNASPDFRLAVCAAEFAEHLRGSNWARGTSLRTLAVTARELYETIGDPDVEELANLIQRASEIQFGLAER